MPVAATLLALGPQQVLQRLALALCLGLFIGLEREYARGESKDSVPAGLRTFGLIGLLGGVSVYLGALFSPWVTVAVFVMFSGLIVAGYVEEQLARTDRHGVGVTSEVAALLTFLLGCLAVAGQLTVAVVTAVAATVVLSAKKPLHAFVRGMGQDDLVATLKFAVVTFIVLPVLPNRAYGPLGAFNPYHTWLMVVLIAGIGFLGYALTKFIGAERGIPLTGLVGGLASSTAVTLANARRSREAPELARPLAEGVVLACTVMLPRVALIVAAIDAKLLRSVGPPLLAMLLASLASVAVLHLCARRHPQQDTGAGPHHVNPFEVAPALKFALAFALVNWLVKWAQAAHAAGGVYLASGLSGLVDADAAAVSLANQAKLGFDPSLAARGIVLALVVNTVFKGAVAASIGARELGRPVLAAMTLVAIGGGVAVFWLT